MKAIKFFVAAMAMTFAMTANAQISEGHFTANVNLGSVASTGGFGLGVGYRADVYTHDYFTLAWDVAHFEWDAPFDSPSNFNELSLKTGARVFSPTFANDKLRAYTNLAMGYTCVLAKGWSGPKIKGPEDFATDYEYMVYLMDLESEIENAGTSMKGHSAFGLTWGIGVQYNQKWALGYTLQYETWGKSKNHFATISYTF